MATTNVNFKQTFSEFKERFLIVKSKKILYIVLGVITAVVTFCAIYFGLMPINLASDGFKWYLVGMAALWALPFFVHKRSENPDEKRPIYKNPHGIVLLLALGLIVFFLVLAFCVSPLFMAKNYRGLIDVADNADFSQVENYDTMQIPIVDRDLAMKLGDKKLGEDNYGSQFEIKDYTMIKYRERLCWVAPIEYRGFFQWTNKKESPGYVMISATDPSDVKIVRDPLNYVQSAYLGDDLNRKIYFKNMFRYREGNPHLELDDEGNPMFVDAVLKKRFVFTSGVDTVGVVITNAKTGSTAYYATEDVPGWVDRIQPAEIVYSQLDYWGKYVHGFWNSLFAKKDILTVSTGTNYIYSNGNMLLYTGLTSVGSDESIVGVAMTDMRTKNSVFYRVSGATEAAAAQSAIGAEQAQRFTASDPIIINVNGVPTYFMTLKDDEGLIKRYAYVNVTDYTIVATDVSREIALSNYIMKVTPEQGPVDTELTIADIQPVIINNSTVYLIKFDNPKRPGDEGYAEGFENLIFKAPVTLNFDLAFLKKGDRVLVNYLVGAEENVVKKIERL